MPDEATPEAGTVRLFPEFAVLAIVAIVYALLVTHGTLQFIAEEGLNRVYDFLGQSFLQLEATVPTNSESIRVDGRDYVYFGPLPALVRIVLNFVWPEHFGQWGRLTTWAAGIVSLLAWMRIVRLSAPSAGALQRSGLYLAFGLGTPVVYLESCAYIWHESIATALACSLWALACLFAALRADAPPPRTWFGFACWSSGAFLTRLTFGAPLLAIAAWLLASAALGSAITRRFPGLRCFHRPSIAASLRSPAALACLLGPLVFSIGFHSWYNFERFGNPLVFTAHSKVLAYLVDPELLSQVETIGVFNPRRMPVNFANYFGSAGRIDAQPPFVHFEMNRGMDSDLYLPGYREWNVSLWLVSGWLLVGALFGLRALVRGRLGFEAMLVLAFAAQLFVVLTYYWVSHRFSAELLPGLCALFALALGHGGIPGGTPGRIARAALALLLAISLPASLASTLSWNAEFNWGAPEEYRQELQQHFGSKPHPSSPVGR